MKLLVLGGTGGTGQVLIPEALERGHDVVALLRSPEKLTTKHDKLTVVKGDVQSSTDIAENLTGCDAVVSCLGGKPGIFTPCDIYSTAIKAIAPAMKEKGVERFICVTAWGTKDDSRLPFVWRYMLKPSMLKNVVADMEIMEDYLQTEECKHINYTVVRPPRLMSNPSTGKEIQKMEGQLVVGSASQINRQDMAKFMLDCLTNNEWDRKMVAVSGPK